MKRILLSILGGVLFPIILTFLIGFFAAFVEWLFPQINLMDMQVKGQASPGLIFAPIAVPFWIYDYIRFYNYFGLRYIFDTVWFRTTWTLGFNFLLYTILTYLLLCYFKLFGKPSSFVSENPPPPPPKF